MTPPIQSSWRTISRSVRSVSLSSLPPVLSLSLLLTRLTRQNNPLGTCFIVPDFLVDSVGDAVLAPTGSIAQELISMATERPVNISRFMIDRAGSSSYYPTSYSSSSSSHHYQSGENQRDIDDSHRSLSSPLHHTTPPPPLSSLSADLPLSCLCLASVICELFHDSPHSSLRRVHEKLLTHSINHRSHCFSSSPSSPLLSSHPSHSTPALFILNPSLSEICFLTSSLPAPHSSSLSAPHSSLSLDHRLEYLFVSLERQYQWSEWLTTLCGVTVIKGRLLTDPHRGPVRRFLCQDIAMMNGTPLLCSDSHTAQQRQELLGVWFFDSPFDEDEIFGEALQFLLAGDG
jgi:hypothetical protein